MSASGSLQTWTRADAMSASPSGADVENVNQMLWNVDVRFASTGTISVMGRTIRLLFGS